jgi:hypothetical protein
MANRSQIPEDSDKQAAEAAQEAQQKFNRYGSMAHLSIDDFTPNNPDAEYIKGRQKPSGGWLHAPAQLELFKAARTRLNKLAMRRDLKTRRVRRVRAFLQKGTTLAFLFPAEDDDLAAIDIKSWGGSAGWINLVSLLGPEELMLPTGIKKRFFIEYAPADCPLGPSLMFDLSNPTTIKGDAPAAKSSDTKS